MQGSPTSLNALAATTVSPVQTMRRDATAPTDSSDPKKVARDFEALLIQNLLRTMRKSGVGDMSNEESLYYDMFDEKIAAEIARSGRLGLADQIARALPEGDTQVSHTVNNQERLVFAEQLWRSQQNQSTNAVNSGTPTVDSTEAMVDSRQQRQRQFLASIGPHARSEGERGGIDPLPIMAIAALETGWGEHMITTNEGQTSHNYFGIKQHGARGEGIAHDTTEYIDNRRLTRRETFRQYATMSDSVSDFVDFLQTNPRYRSALESGSDPERFVQALHDAGYATDPAYTDKVIGVMTTIRQLGDP